MKSDEELMIDYINGEIDSFDKIYSRYKSRVYGLLSKKLPNEKVDDVFQAVFLKLHEKKHLYKPEYSFAPWFFTLIRNHITDIYRKPQILNIRLEGNEPLAPEDKLSAIIEIPSFNKLSSFEQELLFKKFVSGHNYNELSRELNQTSSSLRKKISRILQKLRKEANNLGGAE